MRRQTTQSLKLKILYKKSMAEYLKQKKKISELENKMVETTSEKQNKLKRMKRTEDNLRDIWDNIKHNNIRIIQVPEEEEKKKGYKKHF